jgi:deoxyribose-phosphate aldolase
MLIKLADFRRRIEFSLCQQFASDEDVRAFVEKAKAAGVGVACVNPVNVALTTELLGGEGIEISGNVGFPFGSHPTSSKVLETTYCIEKGATQIDMVMDIGALKSGRFDQVGEDITAVVDHADGRIVKVIIEAWVLTDEEKVQASRLVEESGAQTVKTSTGVRTQYLDLVNPNPRGATLEDVALIRSVVGANTRVKASGGIYTLDDAVGFLKAGADQLGVSKGAEIIQEFAKRYPEGLDI